MVAEGNLRVLPPSVASSFSGYHFSSVVSSCGKSKKQVLRRQLVHCIPGIARQCVLPFRAITLLQQLRAMTKYSGAPLLWTPWGPGEVSRIERCPHFRGTFVLRKHIWDITKCP